jgi:molybdopterin/thiamine biosynthesis adenylyltransferase
VTEEGEARLAIDVEAADDRYHRQTLISWWDQTRLSSARVLVVGAGALGNELVKNLALLGVGNIAVVDFDRIENSNLARCVFFRTEDEGRSKADVLAERVTELNPEVRVIPLPGDIRLRAGISFFAAADVVLGGLDNREARLFVNQACWKTSTPWVDGAIEGLMGVVRVFDPPASACYECTMTEGDYELLQKRRTCTLLAREDMLGGKVPTTATSSSIVAGIQAQEAVKLLHGDRVGKPALAGKGYHFVGLTHDSYVVAYTRNEDCYSHVTYDLDMAETVDTDPVLGDLLERARKRLGAEAVLELEHEVVLGASCSQCGASAEFNQPIYALGIGAGVCPECSNQWALEMTHGIDGSNGALLARRPSDFGLPPGDAIIGRAGYDRVVYLLTGGADPWELVAATAEVET